MATSSHAAGLIARICSIYPGLADSRRMFAGAVIGGTVVTSAITGVCAFYACPKMCSVRWIDSLVAGCAGVSRSIVITTLEGAMAGGPCNGSHSITEMKLTHGVPAFPDFDGISVLKSADWIPLSPVHAHLKAK